MVQFLLPSAKHVLPTEKLQLHCSKIFALMHGTQYLHYRAVTVYCNPLVIFLHT